ncbi:hypothetical protein ACA910_000866 [Epithemia clementina (nom. ined.)]
MQVESSTKTLSVSHPKYNLDTANRTRRRRRRNNSDDDCMDWFPDLLNAIQFNRWEHLRGILSLAVSQQDTQVVVRNDEETQKQQQQKSFWRRIANSVGVGEDDAAATTNAGNYRLQHMKAGLLRQEKGTGRTPLNYCLHFPEKTPTDVILYFIRLEPRAARIPENDSVGGKFPLHTAVMNQMHLEVIASLVEAYPAGISELDASEQSPLSYACERAKGDTDLQNAPKNFWMAQKDVPIQPEQMREASDRTSLAASSDRGTDDGEDNDEGTLLANKWQEEQVDRWSIVHWLLLASATHPQTSLTVGGKKPMLVDALVFAAPPAVISLLIGASVGYLTFEKRATAFAGTTIYTCIYRHYPLPILLSLCLQCPRDVRLVQDETGMGLVAAQFVAGFFRKMSAVTEEWTVVMDFVRQAEYIHTNGELSPQGQHPGFWDWWKKIEFLIGFGTGQKVNADKNFPTKLLLHAALANSDVPPLVIRLLLALYPDSIQIETPNPHDMEGSLPIHLACVSPDYIPRHYELQLQGSSLMPNSALSTIDIVVRADPKAVTRPYKRRLPLHLAIQSGKLGVLKPLVDAAPETLFYRDPETFLYPFLHVSAVGVDLEQRADGVLFGPEGKYNSHSRWAFSARNKYTHHVWKGLSDRQRSNAVQRQYNTMEVLERLSTAFKLLRMAPSVMDSILAHDINKKKGPIREARDESGMGTVAQYYLNYLFHKPGGNGSNRELITEHVSVFHKAIELAPSGDWSSLPPEFERWWNKMRFWIKYCCPKPSSRLLSSSNALVSSFLPNSNERYTLHMAVLNPDTPPPVIELILAVSVASASMRIPGTQVLPLHLAVQTTMYVPRPYEQNVSTKRSMISMIVDSYAQGVSETTDEGKLPLHLAIQAGRANWSDELEPLVKPDPGVLLRRDPTTNLYPFQLMAVKREFTPEDRVRFLYMARNESSLEDWNKKTALQQTQAVYQRQGQHHRDILSSIFELLRRDVTMIAPAARAEPSVSSRAVRVASQEQGQEDTETSCDTSYIEEESGQHYLADHEHTETSKSLTEADTIYSSSNAQSPTPTLPSPISHRVINGVGARQIQGYIPAILSSQRHNDADSDHTDATPLPDLDTSNTNRTGIPDLDSSSHASELLEIESQGSNNGSSAPSRRSGLQRSPSGGTLSSQGSRVQDPPEKTSLMNLLSQHESKHSTGGDVYECDASILSNLDVMSTLSSTIHNHTAHSRAGHHVAGNNPMLSAETFSEEEDSEDLISETEGCESSAYEFACESDVGDTSFTFAGDESSAALSLPVPSDFLGMMENDEESDSEDSDDGGFVTFEYKRKRRNYADEKEVATGRLPVSIRASGQMSEMAAPNNGSSAQTQKNAMSSSQSSATIRRGSVTSLRSHLSDLTASHIGESKHTFKSFGTEGSTKSFATSGEERSVGTNDEKSFATASVSGYTEGKRISGQATDNLSDRMGMAEEAAVEDGHDHTSSRPKQRVVRPKLNEPRGSRPETEASSELRSTGDDSYRSISLPFEMIDAGSRAVGMVWLEDEAEINGIDDKKNKETPEANQLLLHQTLGESKDNMFLFSDSDHSKKSFSASHRSAKSVSFRSLKARSNLEMEDDKSESSSVMEFIAESSKPKSILSPGDKFDKFEGASSEEEILDRSDESSTEAEDFGESKSDDDSETTIADEESEPTTAEGGHMLKDSQAIADIPVDDSRNDGEEEQVEVYAEGDQQVEVNADDFANQNTDNDVDEDGEMEADGDFQEPEQEENVCIQEVPLVFQMKNDHDNYISCEDLQSPNLALTNTMEGQFDHQKEEEEAIEDNTRPANAHNGLRKSTSDAQRTPHDDDDDDDDDLEVPGTLFGHGRDLPTTEQQSCASDKEHNQGGALVSISTKEQRRTDQEAGFAGGLATRPESQSNQPENHLHHSVGTDDPEECDSSLPLAQGSSMSDKETLLDRSTNDAVHPNAVREGDEVSEDRIKMQTGSTDGPRQSFHDEFTQNDHNNDDDGSDDCDSLRLKEVVLNGWTDYVASIPKSNEKCVESDGRESQNMKSLPAHFSLTSLESVREETVLPESKSSFWLETIEELSTSSSHMSSIASVADLPLQKEESVVLFDRATMRWVKQTGPPTLDESGTTDVSDTAMDLDNHGERPIVASKKRLIFDRITFRWREATDDEPPPSFTAHKSDSTAKPQRKRKQKSVKLHLGGKASTLRQPLGSIPEQQTSKENSPAPPVANDLVCLICEHDNRVVVVKPCFHLAICAKCSAKFVQIDSCPLCQSEVTGRIQLSN